MWTRLLSFTLGLPFNLWSFITTKPSLALKYLMTGLIVIMGVLMVYLWGQNQQKAVSIAQVNSALATERSDKIKISGRLQQVENINEQQQANISFLEQQRQLDSDKIAALEIDNKRINQNDRNARSRLNLLEKNNAKVREYINQPLPDELKCLLNNTCAGISQGPGADSHRDKAPSAAGQPGRGLRSASK